MEIKTQCRKSYLDLLRSMTGTVHHGIVLTSFKWNYFHGGAVDVDPTVSLTVMADRVSPAEAKFMTGSNWMDVVSNVEYNPFRENPKYKAFEIDWSGEYPTIIGQDDDTISVMVGDKFEDYRIFGFGDKENVSSAISSRLYTCVPCGPETNFKYAYGRLKDAR